MYLNGPPARLLTAVVEVIDVVAQGVYIEGLSDFDLKLGALLHGIGKSDATSI